MWDNNAVYVNFYRNPNGEETTSSVHPNRRAADFVWNSRWDYVEKQNQKSTKQRVACIRVPVVCIDGQFDL